MNKFWQFNSINPAAGELILYGSIKSEKPWWVEGNDGIYPRQFADDLKTLGAITDLTVRVNSGGGDVSAAIAIYTQLKSHPANVTAIIEGMAASAMTIIIMAADVIKAPAAAQVMIHDPLLMLYGLYNSGDMDKMKAILETSKNSIMNAYMNKTGRDRAELSALMTEEKWMTAEEAKKEGFVDEIMFEEKVEASITNDNRYMVVNSVTHDMSQFTSRPIISNKAALAPLFPIIPLVQNHTKERENTVEIKNMDDLKKHYPDIYDEVVNAATSAERSRMKAIEEISANISSDLVASAKYDSPMNAAELALASMKADAGKGITHMENRQQELQQNASIHSQTPPGHEDLKKQEEAQNIDLIAAAINAGRGTEGK